MRLTLIALVPVLVSAAVYIAEKRTAYGRLKPRTRGLICGILFGGLAVLATEFGVDANGATINARDAAPLCAGLIFGAPAGIIAGLIGGIERWFATLWGAGSYTRTACTLSTVFAGLIGAALRRYMFDDKKPSRLYAFCIGLVTEVIHMLMIFLTNMSDIATAFTFVEKCSLPMITVNSAAVTLAVFTVTCLSREKIFKHKPTKQIATMFQRWLMVCVTAAFIITCTFTAILQANLSRDDTDRLLRLNLSDVRQDVMDASDNNLLTLTRRIARELNDADTIGNEYLRTIARRESFAEIDVIDDNGMIEYSTNESFVGYDMSSGEQSAAFLVINEGQSELVQSYQPISYSQEISRKYAGVALKRGGFVQVGYDAENFQSDIASQVIGAAKNRHIGQNGCVIITDEDWDIVSDRWGYEGQNLVQTGLWIDLDTMPEGERFAAEVYGKQAYCMYIVAEGFIIIATIPVSEATFTRDISVYVTMFMQIVVFVGLFVLIYLLIKKLVVKNIRRINAALDKITNGNLNVTVDVRDNEEFASLSDDINSTVVTLKRYIAEAAARIDRELEFAKSIQHASLPSVFPPYPNRMDFDLFACMDTAKEVGGDFYDFYLTSHSELVFLIADVSGKGIPAAMFMMRAKTLIKSLAETGMAVEEVFTRANENLCAGNEAEMFVTAWIGKIDLKTGIIRFANAGHNPPLIRHAEGGFEYLRSRPGFVLAGMEGIKYRQNEARLSPGDVLFLYTDGVTEATDVQEQLYGDDRLQAVLNRSRSDSPKAFCKEVKADVDAFVGEAPQFDDMTMLCLIYKEAET